MIRFSNIFTKITGWPVQKLCFRTKILYEDKEKQSRRIKGGAIIVSNHTSVFDYAVFIFVFFSRTLRYQIAELQFEKKLLGRFLKMLGGIRVNRDAHDVSCLVKSEDILRRGGVVGIFPEGRLPLKTEKTPLPFKVGAVYLALAAEVPIIPVYTNGSYFSRKRAVIMIGTPFDAAACRDENLSDSENLKAISEQLRKRIITLKEKTEQNEKTENKEMPTADAELHTV